MGRRGTAPPGGQAAEVARAAFDRTLEPYFTELLQAARREVRYRVALGQLEPNNPGPEQLLGIALQRAWRERSKWPSSVGIKAWVIAALFRTADTLAAHLAERDQRTTELLPEEVAPDPRYEDDEEEFWESHELAYPRDSVVFSGGGDRGGDRADPAADDDELAGTLSPHEREVLLMHEVHKVGLDEVALALGVSPTEAEDLLASARRRVAAAAANAGR